MTNIQLRTGPIVDYVTPDYRATFENHVIDTYMDVAERIVPNISYELYSSIFYSNPEIFIASLYGQKYSNEHFFVEATQTMNDREKSVYINDCFECYLQSPDRDAEELYGVDMKVVLQYYKLSFQERLHWDGRKLKIGEFYRNLPTTGVW